MSSGNNEANQAPGGQSLRKLQRQRRRYVRTSDWLLSYYDRLLNSRLGQSLPCRGRVRALRMAGVPDEVCVRLGSTDWMVVTELLIAGAYDALFSKNLGELHQIVDLGANIGISVRLWRTHFPSARVIAVEPDAGNLEICRRNLGREEGSGQIQLIQACAGSRNRWVQLDRSQGEWATRMRPDGPSGDVNASEAGTVAVLTLPEIFRRGQLSGQIDLLKCDIEGAERELFENCGDWLNTVRNILIELHGDYTPDLFLEDIRRNGGNYRSELLDSGPGYAQLLLTSQPGGFSGE